MRNFAGDPDHGVTCPPCLMRLGLYHGPNAMVISPVVGIENVTLAGVGSNFSVVHAAYTGENS